MKNINTINKWLCSLFVIFLVAQSAMASSHREAPLIANDPLADNVDLYAFRSPDNPNTVTVIATYVPLQLPHGGPNYYNFGENVRYEVHIDNDTSTPGDDITYRFTFDIENEDPTTFFNIRLGKQNQKATYMLERSTDGGETFMTIIENGIVPPNNIGTRSIEGAAGLNTDYETLMQEAIIDAGTGEKVYAGPSDDPFFVDLGGIFDLGDAPRQDGKPVDGVACYNVHTIAIQIPISTLLKESAGPTPTSILDPDYVIGVWASASRPSITTLSKESNPVYSGDWVQVSRLGMPLTNEAVIPIGDKDYWNSITPYEELADTRLDGYFYNPELALYMDDDLFGDAVPAFAPLRIQTNSLGAFDFTNGADGLFGLKGSDAVAGTAFDDAVFGTLLLPGPGQPRSVDLWPAFHTGVPNVVPYQLATGKEGNPLAEGKPFINNFLPNGGDMLRLNMAVPVTPRDDENFSSLGLIQAAAIGLTVAPFNTSAELEFIPNMDGFPNGRRLEDDVTRIELQAVSGAVLAAVGLWYDDYDPTDESASPVTEDLLNVLTYSTGVESNDVAFQSSFPYVAMPHSGTGDCSGEIIEQEEEPAEIVNQFFVSSNTSGVIGNFQITDEGEIALNEINSEAMDADGIYYDRDADVLYQLNRTDNVINAYSNVSTAPELTAISSSDFSNGREIVVSSDKLIVAQDATDENDGNKFVIYTISPTSITYDRELTSSINLWGMHITGSTLYAISDNTNQFAVYEDIFSQTDIAVPDHIVPVEGIIRTHGIVYAKDEDIMILTDVGEGSVADDGAVTVISDFQAALSNNIIAMEEQVRIEGDATFLGNPVDVAYDRTSERIYVAERANNGGRVLGFEVPSEGGNQAPVYNVDFAGASAIYFVRDPEIFMPFECNVSGGMLTLSDGSTETTICADDGESDALDVSVSGNEGDSSKWIITDSEGNILGLPDNPPFDLEGAGAGDCNIYSISFSGSNPLMEVGGNIADLTGCFKLSNPLTVTRLTGDDCDQEEEVAGCPTPTDIRVRRARGTRYRVSWDRVSEARGYNLRIRYKGVPQSQAVIPVRNRKVFITTPPGRILEVEIQSICSDGLLSNYTKVFEIGEENAGASSRSASRQDSYSISSDFIVSEFAELYPNPTVDMLNMAFETGNDAANLQLYNLQGQKVLTQRLLPNEILHRVDVSTLPEGTYLLQAISTDGTLRVREKFVKVTQ